jgi:hypothetical protein
LEREKFCGKCGTQNPLFSTGTMVTAGAMTAGAMDMVREIATDTGKDIGKDMAKSAFGLDGVSFSKPSLSDTLKSFVLDDV